MAELNETEVPGLAEGGEHGGEGAEHNEDLFSVHEGKDVLFVGLVFIVALVFGMIFRVLERKIPIPYTLSCLLLGGLLGELSFHVGLGALGDSIQVLLNLHPHTIIFLFLPPLIYESASSMDYHTYKRSLPQSLLLAGPGVFISAGLTTLVGMYIFPYEWDFVTAMTLGAILSATDPVAVVALLRELGAPRALATIIEGESLLNDGVAFVLFTFFFELLLGEELTVLDFFIDFLYAALVGYALGWVLGQINVFLMGLIFDDSTTIIILSIVGAFGAFYIGDGLLQVSGVLAVVAFGLAFASTKNGNIHESAEHALHHIWETMGFVANTLVFVYSGIIIIYYVFRENRITASDFNYLMILYVLINIIRGIVVAVLSPFLASTGYGINLKQGILFTWGGLRGAVGLTLGLIVVTETKETDPTTGARIIYHVAGIAALTLLINGTTAGWVVRQLKLDRSSAASKVFYFNAIEKVKDRVENTLSIIRRDNYFKGADWNDVWANMPILSQTMQRSIEAKLGHELPVQAIYKSQQNLVETNAAFMEDGAVQSNILKDAQSRFLDIIKQGYSHEFEHASIESRPAFQILVNAATAAQDRAGETNCEWDEVRKQIKGLNICNYGGRTHKDWNLALRYELAAVFIKVHLHAEHEFAHLIGDDHVSDVILSASNEQVAKAQEELDEMNTNQPEITGTFKTRWATQWVLNDIWGYAGELRAHGEIEDKEFNMIMRELKQKRDALVHQKFHRIRPQDQIQVLRNSDLFEHVKADLREKLVSAAEATHFNAGKMIQREGEEVNGIFIITNGLVEMSSRVRGQQFALRQLTSGQIIGNVTFATKSKSKWTMTCKTEVDGYFLKTSHIQHYLKSGKHSQFKRNIYFNAGITILDSYHTMDTGNTFTPEEIHTMITQSELLLPENGQVIEKEGGIGVLFSGSGIYVLEANKILKDTKPILGVTKFDFDGKWQFKDAVVMWVPPKVSWIVQDEEDDDNREQFKMLVHCIERNVPQSPATGYRKHQSPARSSIASMSSRRGRRRRRRKSKQPSQFQDNSLAGISDVNFRMSTFTEDDFE